MENTAGAAPAAAWPEALQAPDLQARIQRAKVLCVGAGGIGCELLKTLVCSGFEDIELIDLDTIETSNLNRQFLFRKHHVGQSKARVAAEVVRALKPAAKIVAHHANIKEGQFNIDFFRRFDIVLNGLDNLDARRHVNRLCMAAQVPLIESGTAGYLGQVTVHIKGRTECFECQPKSAPKSFPICTLRNTPDRPIHCIVWAKDLLFPRMFGKPEDVTDLDETSKEGAAAETKEGASTTVAKETAAETKGAATEAADATNAADAASRADADAADAASRAAEDASFFLRRDGEEVLAYASRVFDRLYRYDMERLARMEDLWKKRAPPKALHLEQLLPDLGTDLAAAVAAAVPGSTACKALGLADPNKKWDARDNARVFVASLALFLTQRPSELGALSFDKDDALAVDFVAAASNLRSICYDIPVQSSFDAKGMAGNIIHAIATTNAIISGLIVVEALKVLAGALPSTRCTFLYEHLSSKRLLAATKPEAPCPGCMACGQAQLCLRVNTRSMTLGGLIDQVLKKRLAVCVPMLQSGDFLYEEGEGLEEDEVELYQGLRPRTLSALPGGGLHSGSIVCVKDELQHFNLQLIIAHQEEFDAEQVPEGFVLEGAIPVAQQAAAEPSAGAEASGPAADEDDGCVLLDEAPAGPSSAPPGGKRKRQHEGDGGADGGGGGGGREKKAKPGGDCDDDAIEL